MLSEEKHILELLYEAEGEDFNQPNVEKNNKGHSFDGISAGVFKQRHVRHWRISSFRYGPKRPLGAVLHWPNTLKEEYCNVITTEVPITLNITCFFSSKIGKAQVRLSKNNPLSKVIKEKRSVPENISKAKKQVVLDEGFQLVAKKNFTDFKLKKSQTSHVKGVSLNAIQEQGRTIFENIFSKLSIHPNKRKPKVVLKAKRKLSLDTPTKEASLLISSNINKPISQPILNNTHLIGQINHSENNGIEKSKPVRSTGSEEKSLTEADQVTSSINQYKWKYNMKPKRSLSSIYLVLSKEQGKVSSKLKTFKKTKPQLEYHLKKLAEKYSRRRIMNDSLIVNAPNIKGNKDSKKVPKKSDEKQKILLLEKKKKMMREILKETRSIKSVSKKNLENPRFLNEEIILKQNSLNNSNKSSFQTTENKESQTFIPSDPFPKKQKVISTKFELKKNFEKEFNKGEINLKKKSGSKTTFGIQQSGPTKYRNETITKVKPTVTLVSSLEKTNNFSHKDLNEPKPNRKKEDTLSQDIKRAYSTSTDDKIIEVENNSEDSMKEERIKQPYFPNSSTLAERCDCDPSDKIRISLTFYNDIKGKGMFSNLHCANGSFCNLSHWTSDFDQIKMSIQKEIQNNIILSVPNNQEIFSKVTSVSNKNSKPKLDTINENQTYRTFDYTISPSNDAVTKPKDSEVKKNIKIQCATAEIKDVEKCSIGRAENEKVLRRFNTQEYNTNIFTNFLKLQKEEKLRPLFLNKIETSVNNKFNPLIIKNMKEFSELVCLNENIQEALYTKQTISPYSNNHNSWDQEYFEIIYYFLTIMKIRGVNINTPSILNIIFHPKVIDPHVLGSMSSENQNLSQFLSIPKKNFSSHKFCASSIKYHITSPKYFEDMQTKIKLNANSAIIERKYSIEEINNVLTGEKEGLPKLLTPKRLTNKLIYPMNYDKSTQFSRIKNINKSKPSIRKSKKKKLRPALKNLTFQIKDFSPKIKNLNEGSKELLPSHLNNPHCQISNLKYKNKFKEGNFESLTENDSVRAKTMAQNPSDTIKITGQVLENIASKEKCKTGSLIKQVMENKKINELRLLKENIVNLKEIITFDEIKNKQSISFKQLTHTIRSYGDGENTLSKNKLLTQKKDRTIQDFEMKVPNAVKEGAASQNQCMHYCTINNPPETDNKGHYINQGEDVIEKYIKKIKTDLDVSQAKSVRSASFRSVKENFSEKNNNFTYLPIAEIENFLKPQINDTYFKTKYSFREITMLHKNKPKYNKLIQPELTQILKTVSNIEFESESFKDFVKGKIRENRINSLRNFPGEQKIKSFEDLIKTMKGKKRHQLREPTYISNRLSDKSKINDICLKDTPIKMILRYAIYEKEKATKFKLNNLQDPELTEISEILLYEDSMFPKDRLAKIISLLEKFKYSEKLSPTIISENDLKLINTFFKENIKDKLKFIANFDAQGIIPEKQSQNISQKTKMAYDPESKQFKIIDFEYNDGKFRISLPEVYIATKDSAAVKPVENLYATRKEVCNSRSETKSLVKKLNEFQKNPTLAKDCTEAMKDPADAFERQTEDIFLEHHVQKISKNTMKEKEDDSIDQVEKVSQPEFSFSWTDTKYPCGGKILYENIGLLANESLKVSTSRSKNLNMNLSKNPLHLDKTGKCMNSASLPRNKTHSGLKYRETSTISTPSKMLHSSISENLLDSVNVLKEDKYGKKPFIAKEKNISTVQQCLSNSSRRSIMYFENGKLSKASKSTGRYCKSTNFKNLVCESKKKTKILPEELAEQNYTIMTKICKSLTHNDTRTMSRDSTTKNLGLINNRDISVEDDKLLNEISTALKVPKFTDNNNNLISHRKETKILPEELAKQNFTKMPKISESSLQKPMTTTSNTMSKEPSTENKTTYEPKVNLSLDKEKINSELHNQPTTIERDHSLTSEIYMKLNKTVCSKIINDNCQSSKCFLTEENLSHSKMELTYMPETKQLKITNLKYSNGKDSINLPEVYIKLEDTVLVNNNIEAKEKQIITKGKIETEDNVIGNLVNIQSLAKEEVIPKINGQDNSENSGLENSINSKNVKNTNLLRTTNIYEPITQDKNYIINNKEKISVSHGEHKLNDQGTKETLNNKCTIMISGEEKNPKPEECLRCSKNTNEGIMLQVNTSNLPYAETDTLNSDETKSHISEDLRKDDPTQFSKDFPKKNDSVKVNDLKSSKLSVCPTIIKNNSITEKIDQIEELMKTSLLTCDNTSSKLKPKDNSIHATIAKRARVRTPENDLRLSNKMRENIKAKHNTIKHFNDKSVPPENILKTPAGEERNQAYKLPEDHRKQNEATTFRMNKELIAKEFEQNNFKTASKHVEKSGDMKNSLANFNLDEKPKDCSVNDILNNKYTQFHTIEKCFPNQMSVKPRLETPNSSIDNQDLNSAAAIGIPKSSNSQAFEDKELTTSMKNEQDKLLKLIPIINSENSVSIPKNKDSKLNDSKSNFNTPGGARVEITREKLEANTASFKGNNVTYNLIEKEILTDNCEHNFNLFNDNGKINDTPINDCNINNLNKRVLCHISRPSIKKLANQINKNNKNVLANNTQQEEENQTESDKSKNKQLLAKKRNESSLSLKKQPLEYYIKETLSQKDCNKQLNKSISMENISKRGVTSNSLASTISSHKQRHMNEYSKAKLQNTTYNFPNQNCNRGKIYTNSNFKEAEIAGEPNSKCNKILPKNLVEMRMKALKQSKAALQKLLSVTSYPTVSSQKVHLTPTENPITGKKKCNVTITDKKNVQENMASTVFKNYEDSESYSKLKDDVKSDHVHSKIKSPILSASSPSLYEESLRDRNKETSTYITNNTYLNKLPESSKDKGLGLTYFPKKINRHLLQNSPSKIKMNPDMNSAPRYQHLNSFQQQENSRKPARPSSVTEGMLNNLRTKLQELPSSVSRMVLKNHWMDLPREVNYKPPLHSELQRSNSKEAKPIQYKPNKNNYNCMDQSLEHYMNKNEAKNWSRKSEGGQLKTAREKISNSKSEIKFENRQKSPSILNRRKQNPHSSYSDLLSNLYTKYMNT